MYKKTLYIGISHGIQNLPWYDLVVRYLLHVFFYSIGGSFQYSESRYTYKFKNTERKGRFEGYLFKML